MQLYPIRIDNQEKKPTDEELSAELDEVWSTPSLTGKHLALGDYEWVVSEDTAPGFWLITVERKEVRDLFASVEDGRLQMFAEAPVADNHLKVLLIDGDVSRQGDYGERRWTPETADNLEARLQAMGVMVIHARRGFLAPRLASFWRWTGKDDSLLSKPILPVPSAAYMDASDREAVRALMIYEGWGEVLASRALKAFGSVGAVRQAILLGDPKGFSGVKGIGAKLIRNAIELEERKVTL